MVKNSHISNHKMTNLRTDEMVLICNLTKIGTDENKAIYSITVFSNLLDCLSRDMAEIPLKRRKSSIQSTIKCNEVVFCLVLVP